MRRREFLGAALAAVVSPSCSFQRKSNTGENRVRISDVKRLILERHEPLAGRCRYVAETTAGRIAQPVLVARRGERCTATIVNALPQPTTVHFHGLTLPEAQDGAGFEPIAPGGWSKRLDFEVRNRSGLYWFHPHAHGFTAEQVHAGLVGLLVVTDDDDAAVDEQLSLAPGNRLALALADVQVVDGSIRPYAPSAEECLHGWLGNRMLVNGAMDFRAAVAPGWVRLQLLKACNARGLQLAFRQGSTLLPFYVLGTDGGLLEAPLEVQSTFLHSAERIDIAVPLEASVEAVSLLFDPRHHVQGRAPAHMHALRHGYPSLAGESLCGNGKASLALHDGAEMSLFHLDAGGPAPAIGTLPSKLSTLPGEDFATAPVRRMRLDFDDKAGFLIDQTPYRRDEVAFSVPRGSREVWEIRNSPISMPHPMHLHGFGFRVLRRQGTFGPARRLATHGAGRLSTDLGVKDTVTLWPNETLWLGVDFSLAAGAAFAGRQRYMLHCHNLEHEDGMMMRNFEVI
jgi:suppressor of ftsI/bilirubin oxidase